MDSGILRNCAACSPGRADLAWSPGCYGRGSLWSGSETVQLGLGRRSWCCQSPKPLTRSLAPSELLTLLSASGISALFVWIRHSCFCISRRRRGYIATG